MRVCVFGSASEHTAAPFLEVAEELGALLARRGDLCINGGGKDGCMGALNRGCVENGGRVIGVIHAKWIGEEDMDGIEMVIVDGNDLQERKRHLSSNADCLITLPGGVGTFDELLEAIATVKVGLSNIPICLVNTDGYFDHFLKQLERAIAEGLLCSTNHLFHVAESPSQAIDWCAEAVATRGAANAKPPGPTRQLHRGVLSDHTRGVTQGVLGAAAAQVLFWIVKQSSL